MNIYNDIKGINKILDIEPNFIWDDLNYIESEIDKRYLIRDYENGIIKF